MEEEKQTRINCKAGKKKRGKEENGIERSKEEME